MRIICSNNSCRNNINLFTHSPNKFLYLPLRPHLEELVKLSKCREQLIESINNRILYQSLTNGEQFIEHSDATIYNIYKTTLMDSNKTSVTEIDNAALNECKQTAAKYLTITIHFDGFEKFTGSNKSCWPLIVSIRNFKYHLRLQHF